MARYFACLLAAALFGLASAANAGTIVITITTATGACVGGACTKTFTDTDANLAKIPTAYIAPCQASNNGQACSNVQLNAFIMNDIVNYIKVTTNNSQNAAAEAAVVLPTPINPQ